MVGMSKGLKQTPSYDASTPVDLLITLEPWTAIMDPPGKAIFVRFVWLIAVCRLTLESVLMHVAAQSGS